MSGVMYIAKPTNRAKVPSPIEAASMKFEFADTVIS